MIIAIDVHYRNNMAKVVSIEFQNWEDETPMKIHSLIMPETPAYVPGQFYKRELPCLLEILKLSDFSLIDLIIVDGHVVLDDAGKRGLGAYLYDAIGQKIPVVGAAKKSFHSLKEKTVAVLRGESKKALYISTIGVDLQEMAENIKKMHGDFRIPTLLKILDVETKKE